MLQPTTTRSHPPRRDHPQPRRRHRADRKPKSKKTMSANELLLIIILIHGTRNDEQPFQATVKHIQRDMKLGFGYQISPRQIRRHLKHAEEQGLIKRHRHDRENGRLGPEAQATSYEIPDLKKAIQAGLRPINITRSLQTGRVNRARRTFAERS